MTLTPSQLDSTVRIVREGLSNRFKCEGLSVVLSVDSLPDVGWVSVGEENSWWLGYLDPKNMFAS